MKKHKDKLAEASFGMTITEAHAKKICISCKEMAWTFMVDEGAYELWKDVAICSSCSKKIKEAK